MDGLDYLWLTVVPPQIQQSDGDEQEDTEKDGASDATRQHFENSMFVAVMGR